MNQLWRIDIQREIPLSLTTLEELKSLYRTYVVMAPDEATALQKLRKQALGSLRIVHWEIMTGGDVLDILPEKPVIHIPEDAADELTDNPCLP